MMSSSCDSPINIYNYEWSVMPPGGTTPIRQFGLQRLQHNVTVIAPDTINNQKVLSQIKQLKDAMATKSNPKLMAIVDVQNDFVTGSLKVEGADIIFVKIRELIRDGGYDAIILTSDNHPEGHVSFASSHPNTEPFTGSYTAPGNQYIVQTAWPDHCLQGSEGSEIEPKLIAIINEDLDKNVPVFFFPKGEGLSEAYSAGENVAGDKMPYHDFLSALSAEKKITVDHVGLIAELCVAGTAKSAAKIANIDSRVIGDATMAAHGSQGMQTGSPLSDRQIEELYRDSKVTHIPEAKHSGA